MLNTDCWDGYEIEYNEQRGEFELTVKGEPIANGYFKSCLDALSHVLMCEEPDNTPHDIDCLIGDFLYCRDHDKTMDVNMLKMRIEDAASQCEAQKTSLYLLYELIEMLEWAEADLLRLDEPDRTKRKAEAFDHIMKKAKEIIEKMRENEMM